MLPDGSPQTALANGKLTDSASASVTVPAEAIPGTATVTVKLYPGTVSQILEGLEGMLQQPYGCFEQTSSTTYPNVMVLDYLKSTGQLNPRIQLQAEQYINLGYQRLLTFETNVPGGFSLYGDPTARNYAHCLWVDGVHRYEPGQLCRSSADRTHSRLPL